MGNDKTRNKSKDAQTMGISHCSHPFLQGRGWRRGRLFILFLLLFLTLNFGVKGYWKIKSYSFQSQFKDVWEICHDKGFNEDYCVLVDFSRPSGEDRMAIIDLKTLFVLDTGPCAHGKGDGNSEGVSKCTHPLFLCTKPRLSQARALLFPKVFVPLGIQKFSL